MEKHQCELCGFDDNQEDMVKGENGEWCHYECLQDYGRQELDEYTIPAHVENGEIVDEQTIKPNDNVRRQDDE